MCDFEHVLAQVIAITTDLPVNPRKHYRRASEAIFVRDKCTNAKPAHTQHILPQGILHEPLQDITDRKRATQHPYLAIQRNVAKYGVGSTAAATQDARCHHRKAINDTNAQHTKRRQY